jgi:hypothetical protein
MKNLKNGEYNSIINHVPGVYAEYMLKKMPHGWKNSDDDQRRFQHILWEVALVRLREIVVIWSADEFKNTFIGVLVEGRTHPKYEQVAELFPEKLGSLGLRKAVESLPRSYPKIDIETTDMTGEVSLQDSICILIDDFIDYFDLVDFWKYFVHSVRLLLNTRGTDANMRWIFPYQ